MLVSVYIPTRNRLDKLKLAVASVLEQTHQPIELIVVDEASSDGTGDYLRALARSDARVVAFHHEVSRGAPAARNRAIRAARGDFITGCDDDDRFTPDRIERFLQFWEMSSQRNDRTSCLFTQEQWWNGAVTGFTKKQGSVEVDDLCVANSIGNQVFAPKHVYVEAGLFDESMPAWQDLELWVRVLRRFGPARLIDLPLYVTDLTPRTDRISGDRSRVAAAYQKLCAISFADRPRDRQKLMLQMFSPFYGFKPTLADIAAFVKLGLWPAGLLQLLRARV